MLLQSLLSQNTVLTSFLLDLFVTLLMDNFLFLFFLGVVVIGGFPLLDELHLLLVGLRMHARVELGLRKEL